MPVCILNRGGGGDITESRPRAKALQRSVDAQGTLFIPSGVRPFSFAASYIFCFCFVRHGVKREEAVSVIRVWCISIYPSIYIYYVYLCVSRSATQWRRWMARSNEERQQYEIPSFFFLFFLSFF